VKVDALGAGPRLFGGAAARLGLLRVPALGLRLRLGVGAGPLLLRALDAAIEGDAIVAARPRHHLVDRCQCGDGVLELLVEEGGVLNRRLAPH
jgi:hypothetical protein